MTEAELYKELGALTKDKGRWKESISYVSSLLTHDSVKIQAKALWLLGEMGLMYPQSVQDAVPAGVDLGVRKHRHEHAGRLCESYAGIRETPVR